MLKRRERPSALLSVGGRFLRIWGALVAVLRFWVCLCLYPLRVNFFERISTPVVMSNPQADRVRDIAKLRTRAARTKKIFTVVVCIILVLALGIPTVAIMAMGGAS